MPPRRGCGTGARGGRRYAGPSASHAAAPGTRTPGASGRGQGADCRLAARARTPYQHIHAAHAVLHGPLGTLLGGQLGGERRGLPRALEPDVAGRGPGQHVALRVGNRHDGVVERTLDVGDAEGDVLPLALAGAPGAGCGLGCLGHLLANLLLSGDRLLRSLAGAGVGVGALTVDGQALAVPDALVAADLHLALDVLGNVAAEVALHLQVGVDVVPEAGHLFVGEVPYPGVGAGLGGGADLLRGGPADAEDVGERDLQPLLAGDVDA